MAGERDQRKAAAAGFAALSFVVMTLWLLLPAAPHPPPAALQESLTSREADRPSPEPALPPASAQQGWIEEPPMRLPRRALAVATNGQHIYAVGGMDADGRYVGTTEFAAIGPDGSLGAWQETAALGEPRFYLGAAILHGFIYAIGGATGPRGADNQPVATVERAAIRPDGSLGPWQRDADLTTARRGLRVVTVNNRLYALGGYNGEFLKTSERSEPGSDGALGQWQLESAVAVVDRYIHAAAAYGEHVYLLAGHVLGAKKLGYGNVEASRVLPGGTLAGWRIESSPLQRARFLATALASGDHLYVIGGHDGSHQLASIEYAPIMATGRLGPWRETTPLPSPRSAAAAVASSEWIYVIGGAQGDRPVARVERTHTSPTGRLGS